MNSESQMDNVFTGSIRNPLMNALNDAIAHCDALNIITSFIQVSGIHELEGALRNAISRGVKVKLLTGTYLDITDPDAISLLKIICGDSVSIRFYKGANSFHPKAYFIYSKTLGDSVFVGSSNISKSAFCSGIEWNYRILKNDHMSDFQEFEEVFNLLWGDQYSDEVTDKVLNEYRERRSPKIKPSFSPMESDVIEPNDVQIIACSRLEQTRLDGMDKGLVVAATGTGKTYLAALDSLKFKTVLFVAHSKTILRQARTAFEKVRPDSIFGFCFDGTYDLDADIVFATVQTLRKQSTLNKIDPKKFEYIIVDEFHHAPADSYRRVIDYFRPKFMLGLTATPERMDCQEVFALCENNIVYEIRLLDAIKRGYLCPFKYKGFADTADYDKVEFINGHFDIDSLELQLNQEARAQLIYNRYCQYAGNKTIGFCSSIRHADFMCEYFSKKDVRAATVSSNSSSKYAIRQEEVPDYFRNDRNSVLFVVDMFNEGADIPEIDTVMFLRPTESMTVFIQQLGRGLRLSEGKKELMVLDFIGNYRNADMFPRLILNKRPNTAVNNHTLKEYLPADCDVDYDLETINLFKKLYDRYTRIEDKLGDAFKEIVSTLGRIPTRVEFYNYLPKNISDNYRSKMNGIFKDYLEFISKCPELDSIRRSLLNTDARKYINCLEQTYMSRMYKMPVFRSFIYNGRMNTYASYQQMCSAMKEFYSRDNNIIEFRDDVDHPQKNNWSDSHWIKLVRDNPVKFLCKTHPEIFEKDDDGVRILLDIEEYCTLPAFISEIEDVIEYRSLSFKESKYKRD